MHQLTPIARDLWIVDAGPIRALSLLLPVRMTVIRLRAGAIWLHSPTPYHPALHHEIERLGPIRHLIAPSTGHWRFLKPWQQACPAAITWAVPGLGRRRPVRRAGVRIDRDLPASEWEADVAQTIIPGGLGFCEAAFFHRRSRTLLLTDLVQNLDPAQLPWRARLFGLTGSAPPYLRAIVLLNRRAARDAAARVRAWSPERVIFAHGAWFAEDAAARLEASLSWLLR